MVEIFGEDGYYMHVLSVNDTPECTYSLTACNPAPMRCRFCSSNRVEKLTEETFYCRQCGRVIKKLEVGE